jgi:hypothetical protein
MLRYAAALGLLVDEVAVLSGEPAMSGPDPRGSDVRTAARDRKRASRPPRTRVLPGAAGAGDEERIVGGLLRAFVDSVRSSVASDEACRPVLADLEMFADHGSTLFANLAELARRGRLDETVAVARDQFAADVAVLQAVPAALDNELVSHHLLPDLRRRGWCNDAGWELLGALCMTADPDDLERVLDRFLDRVAAGPPAA